MLKLFCFLILFSHSAYAAMVIFQPNIPVKAIEINQNFAELNLALAAHQININFPIFSVGEVIDVPAIEYNLSLIRNLGISVPNLQGEYIKSQNINNIFSVAKQNINNFNHNNSVNVEVGFSQSTQSQLAFSPLNPELSTFNLNSSAQKGTASLSLQGLLTYTSASTSLIYGTDDLIVTATDGIYQIQKNVKVKVEGSGIISDGTARKYFDGVVAQTCNHYKTYNSGSYVYSGAPAVSGMYYIKPSTSIIQAYCDMDTDGGGWTRIADENPTLSELALFGSTSAMPDFVTEARGFSFGVKEHDSVWGSGNWASNYDINFPHSQVKLTYSGSYNETSNGLGIMILGNESSIGEYVYFSDGYANNSRGQSLTEGASVVLGCSGGNCATVNILNRTYTSPVSSLKNQLKLRMAGYRNDPSVPASTYGYNRRYIKNMFVR